MQLLKNIFDKFKSSSSGPVANASADYCRAVDLGRTRVFFGEGRVVSHKLFLNQLFSIPLTGELDFSVALKKIFEEEHCSSEGLRISLKSPQVITRFLRFPKMSEKELRGVLQFEIEQYVPYEAKDLYMDLSVLQESVKTEQTESTEIFVAVAKKDYLDGLVKQFKTAQAELALVDVDMLACIRALEFFHLEDHKGHSALLDLGVNVSTLGVVRSGLPRFIRDLSFGTQDIAKKLKSRTSISDADIADFVDGKLMVAEDQRPQYADSIENLINDVKVSFDFYRDQSEDGASPDKLIVCGLGSNQKMILESLQKSLDVPVENMNLESKIELGPDVSKELFQSMQPDLPVLLGLILREHD